MSKRTKIIVGVLVFPLGIYWWLMSRNSGRNASIAIASVGSLFLLIIIIAAASSGGSDSEKPAAPAQPTTTTRSEPQPPPYQGRISGTFARGQYDGTLDEAELKDYITTGNVWCAWKTDSDKVVVHVRMTNTSAEHVTVDWYPRYSIQGGGVHGDGFGVVQSDGFDSGEVRELLTEQDPKGIDSFTPLASCAPHFQMIESG
jgi:hypothetical protein